MPGLDPGIPLKMPRRCQHKRDGRDKPGHDKTNTRHHRLVSKRKVCLGSSAATTRSAQPSPSGQRHGKAKKVQRLPVILSISPPMFSIPAYAAIIAIDGTRPWPLRRRP